LLRLLENFFRRWYFYLVPIVLLGVVGGLSVAGSKKQFQSVGTFKVESSTVLSSISGTNDSNFGYDTPAAATATRIGSMLQTDQFVKDIAARANLNDALQSGQIRLGEIRSSISAAPNGPNLVTVRATNANPAVAQALAGSAIDAFTQGIIDSQASQSTAAVAFFTDLAKSQEGAVTDARNALNAYIAAHPSPIIGDRPDDEQAEMARLNTQLTQAQTTYNSSVSKRQDAELSTEQTKADVGQRLRVVDAPQLPTAALGGLKTTIMNFGVFVILGAILSAGALILATLLDHSLRTPADVQRLGFRVLTTVPDTGHEKNRKVKAEKVKAEKPARRQAKPKKSTGREPKPKTAAAPVQRIPTGAQRGTAGKPRGREPRARPVSKAAGGSSWPG
jgi:uncharacterized protein involved in exopolysaccharide biosynthesis